MNSSSTSKSRSDKNKLMFFLLVFAFFGRVIVAQSSGMNLTVNNATSGNGLAPMVSTLIGYKVRAHEISMGMCVQKQRMNISGVECLYKRVLHVDEGMSIFVFFDVRYSKGFMGRSLAKLEGSVRPDFGSYYRDLKLHVLDQHVGVGVKFFNTHYSNCFASIGAGAYETIGSYDNCMFRFRDRVASSLMINFGINFKIFNCNDFSEPDTAPQGKM